MLKHIGGRKCLTFPLLIGFFLTLALSDSDERLAQRSVRHKRFVEMGPDLAGPFCAQRDDVCCPGRDDECTVPVLDTICYCDQFCNHTAYDCCPDYWTECHNPEPPEPTKLGCRRHGREYPGGAVITDNCNTCTCAQQPLQNGVYTWKCTNQICLIQPELLRAVNDGQYGWKAENYSTFWGQTLDDGIRYKLGTMPPDDAVLNMTAIQNDVFELPPESFDAREKWANYINPVRDQGNCGASWAFSTVAVAGDRLAIESSGLLSDQLSPQQLLSCNVADGQLGCDGGFPDKAWWFLRKNGIVSEECYPYESGSTGKAGECLLKKGEASAACVNSNTSKAVIHATPSYRISDDEREIMVEIFNNGPVQATFRVKEDFFMYKSGIYRYSNIQPDNMPDNMEHIFHSARVVGWGVETQEDGSEAKYWIAVNSWGEDWGEAGSFRVARGESELEFQEHMIGVHGDILKVLATHPSEDIRDQGLYNIYNRLPVKIPIKRPRPTAVSG